MKLASAKYAKTMIFLMLLSQTACETENSTREESSVLVSEEATIIAGEGVTVILDEGVSIDRQPDKALSVNQIAQNLIHKRYCRVGDTVTIEAVVLEGSTALTIGWIELETSDEDVQFRVHTDSLFRVLTCADYYKDGETYEFTLFIGSIRFYTDKQRQWLLDTGRVKEGEVPPIFVVNASLIMTEKLEKEIRAAGCWFDREE